MKKKLLIGVGLAALSFAGLALSQTIYVPTLITTHLADLYQVIPNGAPVVGNQYVTQATLTNAYGYYKSAPTSGLTYTFAQGVTYAAFNPSGGINSLYIYLTAAPNDGTRNCLFSSQAFAGPMTVYASLNPSTNSTPTINNGSLSGGLSANAGLCYLYSASNTTWDRS
jgi:hypothetical protein